MTPKGELSTAQHLTILV